jgi:hypothetical protein
MRRISDLKRFKDEKDVSFIIIFNGVDHLEL